MFSGQLLCNHGVKGTEKAPKVAIDARKEKRQALVGKLKFKNEFCMKFQHYNTFFNQSDTFNPKMIEN